MGTNLFPSERRHWGQRRPHASRHSSKENESADRAMASKRENCQKNYPIYSAGPIRWRGQLATGLKATSSSLSNCMCRAKWTLLRVCHTLVGQFCPICVKNRGIYGISVLANTEKTFPGKTNGSSPTLAIASYNLVMLWVRANLRPLFTIKYPHVGWEKWSQMCCILKHKKVRVWREIQI